MAQSASISQEYPKRGQAQLFLVHPRACGTRVICLKRGLFYSAILSLPLFSGVFMLGAQFGSRQGEEPQPRTAALSSAELAFREHSDIQDIQLDALALRLGQLQSQMVRLNVIGQRVVEELDIGRDEFDFSALPPMGGNPNEAYLASNNYQDLVTQVENFSARLYDQELQLQTFSDLLTARAIEEETFPAGPPVERAWKTSSFGWRSDPFTGRQTFHGGIDFAAKRGSDVIAVASGLVIWAAPDSGYGNLIAIDHGDGYVTRYAHNKDLTVTVGDRVEKGDTIAHAGSTGHSTGPHVHFEVLKDGERINPEKFIRKAC